MIHTAYFKQKYKLQVRIFLKYEYDETINKNMQIVINDASIQYQKIICIYQSSTHNKRM